MNTPQDEARRLRLRDDDLVDESGRLARDPAFGSPCLAARTTTIATYPTSARRFYACAPLTILGREIEGGSGNVTSNASTFLAFNLGSVVPPVGTDVLATFVDSRWVFRHDG